MYTKFRLIGLWTFEYQKQTVMKERLNLWQNAINSVVKQEVDTIEEWYQSMIVEAVTGSVVLFAALLWVLFW